MGPAGCCEFSDHVDYCAGLVVVSVISVMHFPKIRMAQLGASFKESWQIRDWSCLVVTVSRKYCSETSLLNRFTVVNTLEDWYAIPGMRITSTGLITSLFKICLISLTNSDQLSYCCLYYIIELYTRYCAGIWNCLWKSVCSWCECIMPWQTDVISQGSIMGLRDQTNTTPVVTVVIPPSENLDIDTFEDTGRKKRGLSDMLSKVNGKLTYRENETLIKWLSCWNSGIVYLYHTIP